MSKRFCIYTVITGGFDEVKQPLVIDDRFDYILFTDNVAEKFIGVWSVLPFKYNNNDKRIASRFPKILPELVLSDYEASLYIDGNIQILSKYVYDRCIEINEKGIEWAGIKHSRKGLYSEINAIVGLGWVHDYAVIDWYKYLRKVGFPDDQGLYENNIIFRKHSKKVANVSNIWWEGIVNQNVKRDQFSLMYALWKVPEIKKTFFLPENENAWHNNGHFSCVNHNPHKRILDKTLWEKLRDRYVRMFYSSGDWEIYYTKWFDKLIKYPCPHLVMHMWTLYMLIRYDLGFLFKRLMKRIKKQ